VTWTISATAAAEADLAEAIDWYEDQTPGLGGRLLDEVNGLRRRIADNPRQFPMIYQMLAKHRCAAFPTC
jgi:hypothetical protein